jgi:hypothetical protein
MLTILAHHVLIPPLLFLIVMYDHDILSYHLQKSPQVISTASFVPSSSPLLLLLQPPSSQSSFSYSMMSHTARSSFSHGQYGLVEFLLVFIHARKGMIIYHAKYMRASHELMSIDHHDRRCQLVKQLMWHTVNDSFCRPIRTYIYITVRYTHTSMIYLGSLSSRDR